MKILALPRIAILNDIDKFEKLNVISILNGNETTPILKNALTLFFDDLSPTSIKYIPNAVLFNFNMANQILNYIEYLLNNNQTHVIIHCSAGVCRSGAVAKFIAEYLNVDYTQFHKDNPNILPNTWVENMLWYTVNQLKGN